jgi:hypothetical protein
MQTIPNRLDKIRAEFDRPGLGSHLARLRADAVRRATSERAPDSIITAAPFEGSQQEYLLSPVKGSIVLFWGRRDSDVIPQLEDAYARGDRRTLKKLSDDAAQLMARRPVGTIEEGVDAVLTSPMYFDLLYGSKELARSLVLPEGNDYGALAFAYNGGAIDEGAFRLVEHATGESDVEYRTLLVRVPPDLTDLEREALEAVPQDQSFTNIGEATMCPAATVAIVLVVVALITKAGIWDDMTRRLDEVTLSDSQIDRLGPLATARELLALRREVFEEFGY